MSRMETLSTWNRREVDTSSRHGPYGWLLPSEALQDVGVPQGDKVGNGVERELRDIRNPFEFVPDEDTKWVSPHDDNYDDDYGG